MPTPVDAFYVDAATLPAPRFGFGLQEGRAAYDALTIGIPFSATFSLTRLSATSWRAIFDAPVYDRPPVRLRDCYVFSPTLTVHSVTPIVNDGTGNVTSVDIVTSEQGPVVYTLTIYGVEVA